MRVLFKTYSYLKAGHVWECLAEGPGVGVRLLEVCCSFLVPSARGNIQGNWVSDTPKYGSLGGEIRGLVLCKIFTRRSLR